MEYANMSNSERLEIRITPEVKKMLEDKAKKEGKKVSQVIKELIAKWLGIL